jgi:isoquinoline 1-oxidoreductase subunit alpha
MPIHTFILNGKRVSADVEDDVRLLWVLRDVLGVKGPKYGCGLGVCQACTSHINGRAFNPCSVPVSQIKPTDRITTIEGLPATVGRDLHPMQEAWLDIDVAQCGYCQPGQIMAAVALVNEAHAAGRSTVSDTELDALRNVCRCGTYPRIREAIHEGAAAMQVHHVAAKRKPRRKRKKRAEHRH